MVNHVCPDKWESSTTSLIIQSHVETYQSRDWLSLAISTSGFFSPNSMKISSWKTHSRWSCQGRRHVLQVCEVYWRCHNETMEVNIHGNRFSFEAIIHYIPINYTPPWSPIHIISIISLKCIKKIYLLILDLFCFELSKTQILKLLY